MNVRALTTPIAVSAAIWIFGLEATAYGQRSTVGSASDAAVMTLYNVASARSVVSSDVSFGSISSAASRRIEDWARQHNLSLGGDYAFIRRGYTVVYGGKSYDCFRYHGTGRYYIVCVRDDGTLLGSLQVKGLVPQPPQ
jgi:hypothetical protein